MAEIIRLTDERVKMALSYPTYDQISYFKVLKDLDEMGVEGIISAGRLRIGDICVLGKGCVGIVMEGVWRSRAVALKVLRADANRPSLRNEGHFLSIANGCRAGPWLMAETDNALVMEFISGKYLSLWLKERHTKAEARNAIGELLRQARCLDEIGLDHGELSDARKHILVESDGRPCIVDFETASMRRRRRNLISIISYLFFKKALADLIGQYISWDKTELLSATKDYKELPSRSSYKRILACLELH